MKRDCGSPFSDRLEKEIWYAEIDSAQVRFGRLDSTAIEFANEIDVWSQMEFRFRAQIKALKNSSEPRGKGQLNLKTVTYSLFDRLD